MGRLETLEHLCELIAAAVTESLARAVDEQARRYERVSPSSAERISSTLISGAVLATGIVNPYLTSSGALWVRRIELDEHVLEPGAGAQKAPSRWCESGRRTAD